MIALSGFVGQLAFWSKKLGSRTAPTLQAWQAARNRRVDSALQLHFSTFGAFVPIASQSSMRRC